MTACLKSVAVALLLAAGLAGCAGSADKMTTVVIGEPPVTRDRLPSECFVPKPGYPPLPRQGANDIDVIRREDRLIERDAVIGARIAACAGGLEELFPPVKPATNSIATRGETS